MLQRYLVQQSLATFFMISAGLGLVIWLSQLLRLIDVIIGKPDAVMVLLELCLFLIPQTLAYALPVAFLVTCVLTMLRLGGDSELAVMSAVGLSIRQITIPFLIFSMLLMIITILLNTILVPNATEKLRDRVFDLRDQVSTNLIEPGNFDNRIPGVTLFIERERADGSLENLFIHDRRDNTNIVTLTSADANMTADGDNLILILADGVLRKQREGSSEDEVLAFDNYQYVIALNGGGVGNRNMKRSEFTFVELLEESEKLEASKPAESVRYLARAHEQISQTLFLPFFAFCVVGIMASTIHHRSNTFKPLTVTILLAVGVRLLGIFIQNEANDNKLFIIGTYAWPILMMLALAPFIMFDSPNRRLKRALT